MKNKPKGRLYLKAIRKKIVDSGVLSPDRRKVGLEEARRIYNTHHKLNITPWPFRRLCYRFGSQMGMWKCGGKPGTIRGTNWECIDQKKLLAFRLP